MFFDKEEVYIGYSMGEVSKVLNALQKENIKYYYKVYNQGTHGQRMTDFGMNHNYDIQYFISVKKKDFEAAQYFVNTALHS